MKTTVWPELDPALAAAGRSRQWLATELGVHRRTLTNWEHGHTRIPAGAVARAAQALGVEEAGLTPRGGVRGVLCDLPGAWARHCQVLTDVPEGSPEWVQTQVAGVDCAELPGVLGVHGASSPVSVWRDKTAGDAPEASTSWHRRLTAHLREDIAEDTGMAIEALPMLGSRKYPWLHCTPSGIADSAFVFHAVVDRTGLRRPPQTTAGGPLHQHVQGELLVTGAPSAIVAWVDDAGRSRFCTVEADPEVQQQIIAAGTTLWGHVTAGTVPPIDGLEPTAAALDALFATDLDAGRVVLDEDGLAADLAARHQHLDQQIAHDTRERALIENKLRAIAGDRAAILDDCGRKIVALDRAGIDEQRLRREHPDLAELCAVTVERVDVDLLRSLDPQVARQMQRTRVRTSPREQ